MTLMDVARGAYVRSPAVVRRSLAPLVALAPTRLKFGGTYRRWRERIARASSDPVFASQLHVAHLRTLMTKAYVGSPFYRDLFDRHLGTGFDLGTIERRDMQQLPVLRKEE